MPLIQFSVLAVLALAGTARAGFLNEPKFTKGAPPTVDFYELISASEIGAYAAHANHGVGTFDGSVIATGTYGAAGVPDSDEPDKLNQNGFVVKADSKGKKVWQFRHETPGRSVPTTTTCTTSAHTRTRERASPPPPPMPSSSCVSVIAVRRLCALAPSAQGRQRQPNAACAAHAGSWSPGSPRASSRALQFRNNHACCCTTKVRLRSSRS